MNIGVHGRKVIVRFEIFMMVNFGQYVNGEPLLASPYVYAVMINIDWFQPFKLTQASIGAIYAIVLNLPYQTRFNIKILLSYILFLVH